MRFAALFSELVSEISAPVATRHVTLVSLSRAPVALVPAASAKPKPKPKAKTVKARSIITVDAADNENGRLPMGLLARAARIAQKTRRPKKPLTDLFTKIAEKSTVDVSQVWEGVSTRAPEL